MFTEQYCNKYWMTEKQEKKWMDPHYKYFAGQETEVYGEPVTTQELPCEELPTSSKREVVSTKILHSTRMFTTQNVCNNNFET
jgi:hypothetical protein